MVEKNYVVIVYSDGTVRLFERICDDTALLTKYEPIPIEVVVEPKAFVPVALIGAVISLLAAAIPLVGSVLAAMVNLGGGMA